MYKENERNLKPDVGDSDPSCYEEIFVEKDNESDYPQIEKPFNPEQIDISNDRQAVSNVVSMIEHDEIDLAPAFQRSGNIWNKGKQSRLIESLLLRIPLPAFYFDVQVYKDEYGIRQSKWQVIDGLQRLCAIRNFMAELPSGEQSLKLEELEFLTRLNGKTFAELPYQYQRIIRESQLTVYLVRPGTPANVKFNIFKRVNTGGVPLTQQEIRHALNQGKPADFLKALAESDHFIEATDNRISPKRMLDREFVNRFLAFYLNQMDEYQDLDSYLNLALERISQKTEGQLEDIKSIFFDTLDTIHRIFGKYAFCKLDAYPRRKPINKVLFEVVTVSIAKLSYEERAQLKKKETQAIVDLFVRFFTRDTNNLGDLVTVSTSEIARMYRRYEVFNDFLKQI